MSTRWDIEYWLDDSVRAEIEYADYWNNAELERGKPWDITEHGFDDVERYLREVGLEPDLRMCLAELEQRTGSGIGGRGIDVAAGTLWAVPILLEQPGVDHVHRLEYSRHRLIEIGPKMLEHYGVDPRHVTLALGSFYELKLPDKSLGFAFLSQALHHADEPQALLSQLHRVLRPEGVAIVVGEHRIKPAHYVRYAGRAVAGLLPSRQRVRFTLRPCGSELEPSDPVLGDHSYTTSEYEALFSNAGFDAFQPKRAGAHYQSFVLIKKDG